MPGARRMALRAQPDLFEDASGARRGIKVFDLGEHTLGQIGILIRSHNRRPSRGHGRLAVRARFGDVALQRARFGILQESASRFDLLQYLPGFAGEGIGQDFQVVGPARRVHGAIQPGFLLQDQLSVARQAIGGLVCLAVGFVERLDLQRIGAADRRGHGFGGGAQHVHVRVVDGFGPMRGARVDRHFGGIAMGGVEALDRAGPHRAGGPQLGDFKEVVGPDGERKRQSLRGIVRREAATRELRDDLNSFGERESEFLDGGRAGFGETMGADGDGSKLRQSMALPDKMNGAIEICQGFVIDGAGVNPRAG